MSSILAIRVDAGPKIGGGHLMRCLALAMEWKRQGGKVIFIAHCENESLLKRITESGMEVINVEEPHPDPGDLKKTIEELKRIKDATEDMNNNWIVLDGYHFDPDYQRAIKETGWKILVIDDMAHNAYYHADIILNQNIGSEQFSYECDPNTKLLIGPEYVLLRPEFEKWRNWKPPIKQQPENLLVTLGAGDPGDIAYTIIEALEDDDLSHIKVRFVIGPAWNPGNDFHSKVSCSGRNIQFVYDPPNMPELMAWADLAISAAGSSCWELCFMGTPFVLIVLAENQMAIARNLEEEGIGLNLGHSSQISQTNILDRVKYLLVSPKRLAKISEIARILVDGMGPSKVVRKLIEQEIN